MTRFTIALLVFVTCTSSCERVSRAHEESARAAAGASAEAAADSSTMASVDSARIANDSVRRDTIARDSAADSTADSTAAMPTTYTAADSAEGAALFRTRGRCFTCHGMRAQGVTALGPALTDTTWLRGTGSISDIATVIRDGVAEPVAIPIRMPGSVNVLSETEITRIAEYVFSLTHAPTAAQLPDSR